MAGDNTLKMKKVWDVSRQLELTKGESASGWTAGTDVTALTTSTTHVTGAKSISYAKSGATVTTGTISTSVKKNGSLFALHKLKAHINLSSLADIATVDIVIGTDASNNNVYQVADTALSTGWNDLDFDCDSPTSINGTGVDWYNILYVAVTPNFDANGDTLTDILVDSVQLYKLEESGGTVSGKVDITKVGGTAITLGEKTTALSFPVTLPSDANPYDSATDSWKVSVLNPVWAQHVEETLIDVTNETDGTNEYFSDLDGYSGLNSQLIISGGSGTMTVSYEGSIQDDGTAAASAAYHDIGLDVFGAATFTSSTILFDDQKTLGGLKFLKTKTVSSTGAANDADITDYIKRLY